jgi:hypothetical protein
MTFVRPTALFTFAATILLVALSATSSDARPHAQRLSPTQIESVNHRLDFNSMRDRDSSCFSRSVGLPDQYACGSHGD